MNKAVFIDRDGTINRDVPYCSRPDDFELLPGVAHGIKLLNEQGFKVVVVTNQSGIARGYFTEEMLAKIHDKMRYELAKYGSYIHDVYYCPHHPDDNCECRKPATGLFMKAAKELQVDLNSSYAIGDRLADVLAAKRVGCKTVLVLDSSGDRESLDEGLAKEAAADFVCHDFYTGATWVVTQDV